MSGFSGMKAWLIQRFSGIYIALYALIFVIVVWRQSLIHDGTINYQQWSALFHQPWLQIATGLFGFAVLFHAWIGLRDIILDYIQSITVKMLVMSFIVLMLLASGYWLLRALFQV